MYTTRLRILISRCRWPRKYSPLMKNREGRVVRREADLVALNINVCFEAILFQEDPAPLVARLNDRDYLF